MNPLSKSHYELFGLPEGYAIDAAALDAAYRSVQGAVHPDRFGGGSETERRIAMQFATQANEAYRTLRDPVQRAAYLCTLHGADPQVHSNTAMPAAFLGQQMQWRERLEEARDARSLDELRLLRAELAGSRASLIARLTEAIDRGGDYGLAAGLVRQLMFVERFAEDVDAVDDLLAAH